MFIWDGFVKGWWKSVVMLWKMREKWVGFQKVWVCVCVWEIVSLCVWFKVKSYNFESGKWFGKLFGWYWEVRSLKG